MVSLTSSRQTLHILERPPITYPLLSSTPASQLNPTANPYTLPSPAEFSLGWETWDLITLGMIPSELEHVLATWNPARGRRPHVLYLIPCGQNPTGSTLSLERRREIYAIAQRYDLIIIEDDPYYFLQYDPPNTEAPSSKKQFPLSFLSMDIDGRVIRIDR